MKRLLLYAMIALSSLPAFADLEGDGYYRVRNAYTKRYAYLLDDKGSYSVGTTTADVGALELYANTDKVLSDPAAVFYIKEAPQKNDYYDIVAQGTSIHGFMDMYVTILKDRKPYDDETTYCIYASKSGVSKYIGDVWDHPGEDKGYASADAKGEDRRWNFYPIDSDSDVFFGVMPTVEAEGRHYAPFFADFPFTPKSSATKIYTIVDIDARGGAIIKEINGTVPASTPVIVECSSTNPSDNRLDIGGDGANVGTNALKGVYFYNDTYYHKNLTPFDQDSMRVLGVGKDGRPAFIRGEYSYVPRNRAYLQLTDPAQYDVDEFLLLTEEQREDALGVEAIAVSSEVDVYRLDGTLLKSGITKQEVNSLGRGIYILRSGSVAEKHVVR